MASEGRVLLPADVKPVKYDLTVVTDLTAPADPKESMYFDGEETITVNVLNPTDTITIHSKEIVVSTVTFAAGYWKRDATAITYQEAEETVTFKFATTLPKVNGATLAIRFRGVLNDHLAGFYRSKYTGKDGKPKYMGTTQFEPTDARRAFPCWDEPALKAKFTITLIVPSDQPTVLSNMPVVSEEQIDWINGEKRKKVVFQETPIVSTYLIAYVVGDFDFVESQTKDGVKVRIYTPVGKKEQGTFALDVAVKTLELYTEYFGIGYPLPKSDMIAIPDFAAGAMENWGLITYRETALLADPKTSGVSTKQRVAYVVGHELAHMWFGNLVTMEWWQELWLNEGFATFVGNLAVDKLFPEWKIWTQFQTQYFARALDLDSLRSSHPIEVPVKNSAQINEIFDAISYCKGASVIRQVFDYIGEDAFKKGLHNYLKSHEYGNAVTVDLWKALGDAAGKDVAKFMSNWTQKTGYPVLSLEREAGEKFKYSQQRFLTDLKPEEDQTVWNMNVGVLVNGKEANKTELSGKNGEFTVSGVNDTAWIKANANQSGFFRVQYSPDLSAKLEKALGNGEIVSAIDRLALQNDAFALAKLGRVKTSSALALARGYAAGGETDYTIWTDIAKNVGEISSVFSSDDESTSLFQILSKDLFGKIAATVGWDKKEGEDDNVTLLRALVIGRMGDAGDEATVKEARERFAKYVAGDKEILANADLRGVVYRIVLRNSENDEDFAKVQKIYSESEMHEEKLRALRALSAVKRKEWIEKILEFGLRSGEVRTQDLIFVVALTSSSTLGVRLTWEWVKKEWEELKTKLGGANLLSRIIYYAIKDFTKEEEAVEVEKFFETHPQDSAKRSLEQGLESVRANAEYVKRDGEDVKNWLKNTFGGK